MAPLRGQRNVVQSPATSDDVDDEILDQHRLRTPGDQPVSPSSQGSERGSPSTSGSDSSSMQSPEDCIAHMFDQRVALLASTLESLRCKCELLQEQLAESGAVCNSYAARLARSEETVRRLRLESDLSKDRERQSQQDVSRLEALLEAGKLQAAFSEARLQTSLAEERQRADRLRLMRDDALLQRDTALNELSGVHADVDALQATLADSALYVRYLRKRLLELELITARQAAAEKEKEQQRQHQSGAASKDGEGGGAMFSLASIRGAIQAAVAEAAQCGEEERRKRVRQLQLRWHPDKNPVLTEFATEVTKIINEAVSDMERGLAKES